MLTLHVKMYAFSILFGMSGCLEPWSRTRPLTRVVSAEVLCCISMISTMCKSIARFSCLIARTASTQISVSFSASEAWIFVFKAVLVMSRRDSLAAWTGTFIWSKISIALILAKLKPSVMSLGWRPSDIYTSACLRNSPIRSTVLVVPSPVLSFWVVEALAMREAVGCWICISWRRTLPSLVILMSPAPDTNLSWIHTFINNTE